MRALGRVRDASIRLGLPWVADAVMSIAASARSRGVVSVRREPDGDWRHRWSGDHLLFSAIPWSTPAAHVAYHHPVFLRHYRPRAGDVVVDCGAGVGTEIRLWSDLVGPSGRVVAVEPDPVAYRRLAKLVRLLPISNVSTIRCAVSDVAGHGTLDAGTDPDSVTAALEPTLTASGDVRVRRLDELMADVGIDHIDYLKLNIEGYEAKALAGLGSMIGSVDNMCISCHDFLGGEQHQTYDEVRAFVEAAGFDLLPGQHSNSTDAAAWYIYASQINYRL